MSKRIREVIEYGNSILIRLHKVDLIDLDIRVGDFVDIGELKVIKKENGKHKKRD